MECGWKLWMWWGNPPVILLLINWLWADHKGDYAVQAWADQTLERERNSSRYKPASMEEVEELCCEASRRAPWWGGTGSRQELSVIPGQQLTGSKGLGDITTWNEMLSTSCGPEDTSEEMAGTLISAWWNPEQETLYLDSWPTDWEKIICCFHNK